MDIFLLQLYENEFKPSFFNIKSYEDVDLVEGTDVYFAGFPDPDLPPFFHKGQVSTKYSDYCYYSAWFFRWS